MNPRVIQLEIPKSGAWENTNLRKVQRFLHLKTAVRSYTDEFLKKVDLLSRSSFEFNERNGELTLERQEFREEKSKKNEESLLKDSVEGLLEYFMIYSEVVYSKYDLSELYTTNKDTFKQEIERRIIDFCLQYYKTLTVPILTSTETLQNLCLKEINAEDKLWWTPTIEAYIDTYKSFEKQYVGKINKMISMAFRDGVNEVFVSPTRRKLSQSVKEIIISNNLVQKHFRNRTQFRTDVYDKLQNMFHRYFIEGEMTELFDNKVFIDAQDIATLFNIILLTDYHEADDAKNQASISTLEKLYDMFMRQYEETFTELPKYLEMIRMPNKNQETIQKINQALEESVHNWNKKIKQTENLTAMMSLFLAFNFLSDEGLDKSYGCHTRYMLKCAFRNLKNGSMQFTNFQVLCCMESLIVEYAKNLDSSQIKGDGRGSIVVQDVLERIRRTSVNSIAEHLKHESQLSVLEDRFAKSVVRPEKFFFEKISDPKVRSKTIIICISGFTSEDHAKSGEWKQVCEAYPDTEVIAVNWKSNALTTIGENMWSNVKEKFNSGSNFFSKVWKGGVAIYRSGRDAWSQSYEQAVLTGQYLAHFLAETELFQGHVVNLIGFSLGTLVIMSCVWELEKMGRHDIIYDVLLMGGVVHIGSIHHSMLKAVGHQLTNCYCFNDYVLQYVLSHVNQNIDPIGLGPILWEDNKVVNIDVTHLANGHNKYRAVLADILAKTDFNEDLEYLINK